MTDPGTTEPDAVSRRDVLDAVVIGGGQAGLAARYFRPAAVSYVILDAQTAASGGLRHGCDSLRLPPG